MNDDRLIATLFNVAGVYEGVLGVLFLIAPERLFDRFGVPPPNHFGYVRFPAALLVVFAVMFFAVAANPRANRNLIPYGILLKASYCGVVFGYWFLQGLPGLWKPFAIVDLVFGVLFLWAWLRIAPQATPAGA